MISSVSIENFKQFSKFSIDKLKRVSVIGGKNNSGKSSFLEAVFLLYDRPNPESLVRQLMWRGIAALNIGDPDVWAPFFYNYQSDKKIIIKVSDSHFEEVRIYINNDYKKLIQGNKINKLEAFGATNATAKSVSSVDFEYFKDGANFGKTHLIVEGGGLSLQIENLLLQNKPCFFIGSGLNVGNPVEDAERFSRLDIEGHAGEIVETLRIIDPKLKSLSVVSKSGAAYIYGDVGLKSKIPVQFMGEGMARLLRIVLAIATSKNGIVFIDEIENGFHHSILGGLWRIVLDAATQYNCQIFCTSHSYEALNKLSSIFDEKNKDEFCYIRLDKVGDEIMPKYYNADILQEALKSDLEIR